MRKAVATAFAVVALLGSAGTYAPAAMAAGASQEAAVAAQADCVKVKRWYSKRFNRMVDVENTCARKVCFTVTVAARKDPLFAIGAKKKESFRYGGTLWTKGTGIKNVAC
ncbi:MULTISPECIES: hypothetical protein [unclassified Streptomyces]|uniref:hypothetical protein n=1 Tax=unclassified Streptomyces TaxID=2593676 RepID=UPI003430BDC7